MAHFKVGKWLVRSYPHGWELGRVRLSKGKKTRGKLEVKDITYYATLSQALNALLERDIRESDAVDVETLLDALRGAERAIIEATQDTSLEYMEG